MKIGVTSVYVDDQEKALRFYTEVLSFVTLFCHFGLVPERRSLFNAVFR